MFFTSGSAEQFPNKDLLVASHVFCYIYEISHRMDGDDLLVTFVVPGIERRILEPGLNTFQFR